MNDVVPAKPRPFALGAGLAFLVGIVCFAVSDYITIAIGLVAFVGAALLGVQSFKLSRANAEITRAEPAAPIGLTTDGKPIYPIVGYTPDGQPVTADQAVGVQSHAHGTNGLAIASLIAAFIVPLVGVILGHVALSQIRRTGQEGRGLAVAGLVIGYISLIATVVGVIAFVAISR